MMKKVWVSILVFALTLSGFQYKSVALYANEKEEINLSVVANESNDLYKTLVDNYSGVERFDSLGDAIIEASEKEGIMVLADAYPTLTKITISEEEKAILEEKAIRLYVEYPENNDLLGISYDGTAVMGHNRVIVTNKDAFGFDKEQYLLYAHGAQFVKKAPALTSDKKTVEDPATTWLVSAKVAGYDTASFGLTDCTPYTLLEVNGNVMVATTKFSQFISARYAPYGRWQNIWDGILGWVLQKDVTNKMQWQPLVDTAYDKEDTLENTLEAYAQAVDLNTQWYLKSGIMPKSDGTLGIYECYNSGNRFDIYGNQGMRTQLRSDCIGESAGNIALAGVILNNEEYKNIARNVMDYLLTVSINSQGERANPDSAEFGLLSWDEGNKRVYYGDDNAKAILGMISAAAALEEDKWDERILQAILGNFRTAGVNGFRGNRLEGKDLESNGWEFYYNRSVTNYASHYESLLWACYLWAYDKTGYEPLLTRTKTAISMMMDAYKETMKLDNDNGSGEWTWTNGMQQERAKMTLPLAWLVRVDPSEEHKAWLDLMITDMMSYQDAQTGALRDVFGQTGEGKGKYGPFTTNSAYGNHEAPVIQENGDPCSDSLYTSAFAMLALNEAYGATGSATYKAYSDALNNYFVKIQQTSTNNKYNGVWFRGFDYDKWETYGSDGDAAWGIWATETGWSQAWISNTLSMKVLNTNLWDYSKTTTVDDHFEETATVMLNYDPNILYTSATSTPAFTRGSVENLLDTVYGSTAWNDGKWSGLEGQNFTLEFDFKEMKTFDKVSLGFNHNMNSGVCIPKAATFYVSEDGEVWKEVGTFIGTSDVQEKYDNKDTIGSLIERASISLEEEVKARYVKVDVTNAGTYVRPQGVTKTWVFMDEFTLNITDPTLADLYTLIKNSEKIDTSAYTLKTVEAFMDALEDAKEVYADKNAGEEVVNDVYKTLKEASENLAEPLPVLVHSVTNQKNSENKNVLTDGNYSDPYVSWQLLLNASAVKNNGALPNEATGEVILDLQEITDVDAIGYSAKSGWRWGIFSHQATFYVADTLDGEWKEIATLGGKEHESAYDAYEYHDYALSLEDDTTGRYIKVVFKRDGQYDGTVGPNGKMYAEWLYVTEIGINRFYPIMMEMGENGSVTTSAHKRGAVRGEDVVITPTPDAGYVVDTFMVDGSVAELKEDGTYVIENVKEAHSVQVTFKEKVFPEAELPTLYVHDFFVVENSEFDPLLEVSAFDKNGNDITSSVKVVDSTLEPFPGTYKVTYEVKDEAGAKRSASANVYVVREEALAGTHVVALTPSTSDALGGMASQLLDGKYAPGTSHSNAEYVSWQNTKHVDIIIDLNEIKEIGSLGYAMLSNPRMGLFKADVEFYVCDTLGTTWTNVGKVDADAHESGIDVYEIEKNIVDVNAKGRYVKIVFKFDESEENLAPYRNVIYGGTTRTFKPEWNFIDEIIIKASEPKTSVTSTPALNNGTNILLDDIYGSTTWNDGKWTGYEGGDITLLFDLQNEKTLYGLSLGFINNMNVGISIPGSVTFYVSKDNENWTSVGTFEGIKNVQEHFDNREQIGIYTQKAIASMIDGVDARYIKVEIKNPGTYKRDRNGDGIKETTTKTWIFMDEFDVETEDPKLNTYSITVTTDENGTYEISTGNEEVSYGGTSTITFIPNANYMIQSCVVNGENVEVENNTLVLENIREDYAIDVTYETILRGTMQSLELDGMKYRLYIPEDYDANKEYPVVLFFHGAGERGSDNESQLKWVIEPLYVNNEELQNAIIIAPQCPTQQQWVDTPWAEGAYNMSDVAESDQMQTVIKILKDVQDNYSTDTDRVYALGYSMGGFATWDILARYPDLIAAGVPLCGAGAIDAADILKDVPIWTFHGNSDPTVPYDGTKAIVDAIVAAKGEVITFTTLEGGNHTSIVYDVPKNTEVIPWLFNQSLEDRYGGIKDAKEALSDFIDELKALEEKDYTKVSLDALTALIEEAEEMLEDEKVITKDVESMLDALQDKKDALVDLSRLKVLIAQFEEVDSSLYTPASYEVYKDAYEEAKSVLADEDATSEMVEAREDALTNGFAQLLVKANKDALTKAVTDVEALKEEDYTKESYAPLMEALKDAKTILADENAVQEDVDAAHKALADAFNALEETPEEKEEAPGTGDTTNVLAWLLMLLAGGFVLTKKRKEV